MSQKILLAVTLSALLTMQPPALIELLKQVNPNEEPDESLTAEDLVNEILVYADPLPDPDDENDTPLPEGHFKHDGKIYTAILPKVEIPGMGFRSALEIAVDIKAQEYLIKNGCIGSVIAEVG